MITTVDNGCTGTKTRLCVTWPTGLGSSRPSVGKRQQPTARAQYRHFISCFRKMKYCSIQFCTVSEGVLDIGNNIPHSFNLALADVYLFHRLKSSLKGRRFGDTTAII